MAPRCSVSHQRNSLRLKAGVDLSILLEGSSDTTLTTVDFSYIAEEFGSPFLVRRFASSLLPLLSSSTFQVVHRSALQKCLISGALESGVVNLHLGHVVEDWDFDSTSFSAIARKSSIEGDEVEPVPEWIKSEVILASDGVKSKARAAMMRRTGEKDDGMSFLGVDSASRS